MIRVVRGSLPLVFAIAVAALPGFLAPVTHGAAHRTGPTVTTSSRYETGTDPSSALSQQGVSDAKAGLSGVTILDFGRPAEDSAGQPNTEDFSGNLDTLPAIATAVESYVQGYLANGTTGMSMLVVIGTNDSCGTGQPCGTTSICGCAAEPPDFVTWGQAWGAMVNQVRTDVAAMAKTSASVTVGGGDDAEPGYDPAFGNTYAVLAGYAETTQVPMIDFGSLDGGPTTGYWTPTQMYDVTTGLLPDEAFPQIYGSWMAPQWAALSAWAVAHTGHPLDFAGYLTESPDGFTPQQAYESLTEALAAEPTKPEPSVGGSSNIGPLG